jgi:C4-dicarboxylate transporter/malic acid transport protein
MNESTPAGSPRLTWDELVRNFAPGWFAAVMGTGVLAITAQAYAQRVEFLSTLAVMLHWFNVALCAVLAVPWLARWAKHTDAAIASLRHPVQAHFYPTFSIALLVLALEFLVFGKHAEIAFALWAAGTVLTLVFSFAILAIVFNGTAVTLDHINPGMFIPPVGLVVVPLAGAALTTVADPDWQPVLLMINWTALGAGFFLYLALAAVTLSRFVLHPRLPAPLTVTVWINLAPPSVIAISLANMAAVTPAFGSGGPLLAAGLMLWGFALWWLVMAVVLTLCARRRGELPFALAWWAFTFPLGAFIAASHRLGTALSLTSVYYTGLAALALLAVLWAVTLVKTVRGALRGELLKGG